MAAVLEADMLTRAVSVVSAASHTDSTSAGLAIRALLSSDTGELALSSQALLSIIQLGASDFWRWVWLVAWWAGTSVSMVFDGAHGSLSTHVSLADVEAGVGQPVTELVSWAVVVLNAVDSLAALSVGIAGEESWWAGALADVVSCHTDGRWPTAEGTASWHTRSLISRHSANFSFLALSIIGAALDGLNTAGSAVRCSGESDVTFAEALVVVGDADGVGWADDGVANVDASSSPEHSFSANFTRPALSIAGAASYDFANAGELVLGVALLAGAQRSAVDDLALLSVRARHDLARIQTGSSSVDVDLANQPFWTLGGLLALLFRETAFLQVRWIS